MLSGDAFVKTISGDEVEKLVEDCRAVVHSLNPFACQDVVMDTLNLVSVTQAFYFQFLPDSGDITLIFKAFDSFPVSPSCMCFVTGSGG